MAFLAASVGVRIGVGVPSWALLLLVGAFDVYFAYFILSLVRGKPIVRHDLRSLDMRLGRILAYAAVAHVIGIAYTLAEGPLVLIATWLLALWLLAVWLVYAWKLHREALLRYNVTWSGQK